MIQTDYTPIVHTFIIKDSIQASIYYHGDTCDLSHFRCTDDLNMLIAHLKSYPTVRSIRYMEIASFCYDPAGSYYDMEHFPTETNSVRMSSMFHMTGCMERFKFVPEDPEWYNRMMDRANARKPSMPWSEFIWYTSNHPIMQQDGMKEAYEASATWKEFFTYVYQTLGHELCCICFADGKWFNHFLFRMEIYPFVMCSREI